MGKHERLNALLELLSDAGRLSVEEAARELQVSPATVRRDFHQLAQQQMLIRTRGGAVAHAVTYDLPLRYKIARHASEKQRIARAAAALIEPGATVGLNGGTTTTEVARALATRADVHSNSTLPSITIVTNAINVANELTVRPQVKIVLTGGVVRQQSYELIGPFATWVVDQVTLDVAILGVNGLDLKHGATCHDEGEASINRLLADRADQVIVVADASKLGQRAFARICDIADIDTLVTDSDFPDPAISPLEEIGIDVIRT